MQPNDTIPLSLAVPVKTIRFRSILSPTHPAVVNSGLTGVVYVPSVYGYLATYNLNGKSRVRHQCGALTVSTFAFSDVPHPRRHPSQHCSLDDGDASGTGCGRGSVYTCGCAHCRV